MLKLVLGRAGTGKTAYAMEDFRRRARAGCGRLLFLVPEQYSHDAERQLCRFFGNDASLYGEVVSFSRLSTRVFAELGGSAARVLDAGALILVMHRAVEAVSAHLKAYGGPRNRQQLYERLLQVTGELKMAGITPERLFAASTALTGPLSAKLHDLALILSAYDSYIGEGALDAAARMRRLTELVGQSFVPRSGCIYIDGFSDFTVQEEQVIEKLLQHGAELMVCLTCDGLEGDLDLFTLPRQTARRLLRFAEEHGQTAEVIELEEDGAGRVPALRFMERSLFEYAGAEYDGDVGAVTLAACATQAEECEYAASRVLALLRAGMRYRDIAVAVPSWGEYGALIAGTFEKYGIPIFTGEKADILQKPPVALSIAALGIITSGWEYGQVFQYLKTGLTGITQAECDLLENYVYTLNIRGTLWTREADWTIPPGGYETEEEEAAALRELNALRRRITAPLVRLSAALGGAKTCGDMLSGLYDFFVDIGLPAQLAGKAGQFRAAGDLRRHDEYVQIWDILCTVSGQFYDLLGKQPVSVPEFARLWGLILSQYAVGVIPVSLDRVSVSELGRSRRRDVRALILLGASDDALPRVSAGAGVLSDSERGALLELGLALPESGEKWLRQEMLTLYSVLTLPSEALCVTYVQGGDRRPSFILRRLSALFGIAPERVDAEAARTAAYAPCFDLAVSGGAKAGSVLTASAHAYFAAGPEAGRLSRMSAALGAAAESISPESAAALYGGKLRMSATRLDMYSACRFAYFMRHGLAARPRARAAFDAPEAGTFLHYVLENVTRDIRAEGGFAAATEARCRALTEKYVSRYIEERLDGLRDKSSRFRYLFRRLTRDAEQIVLDMVEELQSSDFEPIDFELNFMKEIETRDGAALALRGLVDRVDGWIHDGRLYLRVVDYKTGVRSFSLSDVWYGLGMQMLIYLFALQSEGAGRYGREVVPAGVLYAPARDPVLAAERDITDEELARLRAKKLRRSGLLLSDPQVIEAMERGEEKRYLPVKLTKEGALSGDSVCALEQLGKLASHIERSLQELSGAIRCGDIRRNPYYKNERENACTYCEYRAACHLSAEGGGARRYLPRLKPDAVWALLEKEAGE